ncbi:unnamed protein product [Owenia fusiformis]|uniref:Receptor ligand binding region domain-containing protein n=1 Tax=Owenia fusiformis TaxID=6347 RepID=A0A8J1XS05_OWEFU|nr:unnamed protein product [Owenia fusiformis]
MDYMNKGRNIPNRMIKMSMLVCAFCFCCLTTFTQSEASKIVKIAAIIPEDNARLFSISRVAPALDYAILKVYNESILPKGYKLDVKYADSKCNGKDAPIAAFDFYMQNMVNVYFGPCCDYALAPIARYSPHWNIPTISPGGFAHDFGRKTGKTAEFDLLTRVGVTFQTLSEYLITLITHFDWHKMAVLYTSNGHGTIMDRFCYLAVSALQSYILEVGSKIKSSRFRLFLEKHNWRDFLISEAANYSGESEFLSCYVLDLTTYLSLFAYFLHIVYRATGKKWEQPLFKHDVIEM